MPSHAGAYTRQFEGASASQKVRAAERNGELPQMYAQPRQPEPYVADYEDWNKEYFVLRPDGEYFCTLCNAYATEGHIASEKHKNRVAWQESKTAEPDADSEYSRPYFELKEDGGVEGWYCNLCNQWADEWHLKGKKHVKQRDYWEAEQQQQDKGKGKGKCKPAASTGVSKQPEVESWTKHWHEQYARPYWHNRRTGESVWVDPTETARKAAEEAKKKEEDRQAAMTKPTSVWQRVWSAEHKQHYWHNTATNVTQWHAPQALGEKGDWRETAGSGMSSAAWLEGEETVEDC
mmetsp:Transcript_51690/g.123043  ORF Transcript_51690/g.123043 Transcript_51690/m.123043 type:complete len:291 (+) Transcript_51690:82-954(+)